MSHKQAFVTTIQRMFAHEVMQAQVSSDADIKQLMPHHAQIMQIVRFGVTVSETHRATAECVERYFNLIERGRFEEQWLPIVEKLCESAEIQSNPTLWHTLHYRQIILLRLNHKTSAAIKIATQLQQAPLTPLLFGKLQLELSECWRSQDKFERATTYALKALDLFAQLGDQKWQAAALTDLTVLATEQGKFAQAEQYAEQALSIERRLDDATCIVRILTNLGYLYQRMERWELALRVFFEAQEYLSEIDNIADSVTVLINVGYIYIELERFEHAQDSLHTARQQLQERNRGLLFLQGLIALNMGTALIGTEDHDAAINEFLSAIEIWQQLGKRVHLGRTLINLGDAYLLLNRSDLTHGYFQQAHDILGQEASPLARQFYREVQGKLLIIDDGIRL